MLKATLIAALLCVSFGIADAQYVVVLKNGRQLTVQNYREEGSVIKFFGFGGEIAISKDQVQTIRRADTSESGAAPRASLDRPPAETAAESPPAPSAQPEIRAPAAVSLDQQQAKKRAEEAKAYESRLKELTAQLKELRERYSLMTRGNQGPEPSFFTTEEAFRGQQEDLLSRLRDAQNKAQGLPLGGAATSPPFSLDPPPAYSDRQKQLSDLRARITQIENERQKIIDEMRAKGFEVGSLFLE
ncbi:MAG TPA: hypothetical protein VFY96_00545 [Candidatus Binatia bacterium]|nr:hypothetical protein [Candidatus Binatia bacterium]